VYEILSEMFFQLSLPSPVQGMKISMRNISNTFRWSTAELAELVCPFF